MENKQDKPTHRYPTSLTSNVSNRPSRGIVLNSSYTYIRPFPGFPRFTSHAVFTSQVLWTGITSILNVHVKCPASLCHVDKVSQKE